MRVRRVVTTRAGGASRPPYDTFNLGDHVGDDEGDVYANRKRLAAELGLAEDKLAWMEQVHGRTATTVDGSETQAAEATDALVTATPGVALVVLVADCVPILLADAEAGVVSAVHAGRVGTRVGVVPAAVEAMREAGAEVGRIEALLGPGHLRRLLRGAGRDGRRRREARARQRLQDAEGHTRARPARGALAAARRPGRRQDRRRPAVHERGQDALQLPPRRDDRAARRDHLDRAPA